MTQRFAATEYRSLLPAGWDHARARAVLRALLEEAAGPQAGCLFADVVVEADALVFAPPPGGTSARHEALDAAQREALRAELGRLASELRRAAELRAARDPADAGLPALVAAALEVPSFTHVEAWAAPGAEGRPVLLGWGLVPAAAPGPLGFVTRLDDGVAAERHRPWPWHVAASAALALLLLGALAALLAGPVLGLFPRAEPVCRAEPGQMAELGELLREEDRGRSLRRRLAELEAAIGAHRASCPLPEPPKTPEPAKPPEPLPASRWEQGDLGMLEGCWILGKESQTTLSHDFRLESCIVEAGRVCFDANGRGTRESSNSCPTTRISCKASIEASFSGGTLRTSQELVECMPSPFVWNRDQLTCWRVGNDLARCTDSHGFEHDFRPDQRGGR
jgi:hypothetical protein